MNLIRGAICFNITHAILKDKYNAFLSCGCILAFSAIYSYFTLTYLPTETEYLQMAIYYIVLTLILVFTTKGNIFIKVFASVYSLITWIASAFLFLVVINLIGINFAQSGLSYELPLVDFMMYILFLYAFSYVFVFIFKLISGKISNYYTYEKKYMFYFVFPVTHIIFTMLTVAALQGYDTDTYNNFISKYTGFEVVFTICAAICIVADFFIIFIVDKQSKTEKAKNDYEKQILKNEMTYQQTKMLADEKRELRKVKHDLANLLTTAQEFIKIGKPEKALEIIKSTSKNISELSGIPLCSNETINTVFYIKQQLAESLDVDLKIEVEQTHALNVDDYSVCRIMHNILDNALNAAGETEKKQVYLKIIIDEEKFMLDCQNSCPDTKTKKVRNGDHGHGISIIKDIAKKYGGNYNDEKRSGIFHSQTVLNNIKLTENSSSLNKTKKVSFSLNH